MKTVHADGIDFGVPAEHVEYLLEPREVWARAYAQWVATRGGDAAMRDELESWLNSERLAPFRVPAQWDEDDFAAGRQGDRRLVQRAGVAGMSESEDERVKQLMRVMGLDETSAREVVAMESGKSRGDVVVVKGEASGVQRR